jgi:gluconolactonase
MVKRNMTRRKRSGVFRCDCVDGKQARSSRRLKLDKEGNLFASGPGGILVFAPDDTHLGSIEFDVRVSNCAWGGDGSVLFITANTAIYRVKTTTRGAGW